MIKHAALAFSICFLSLIASYAQTTVYDGGIDRDRPDFDNGLGNPFPGWSNGTPTGGSVGEINGSYDTKTFVQTGPGQNAPQNQLNFSFDVSDAASGDVVINHTAGELRASQDTTGGQGESATGRMNINGQSPPGAQPTYSNIIWNQNGGDIFLQSENNFNTTSTSLSIGIGGVPTTHIYNLNSGSIRTNDIIAPSGGPIVQVSSNYINLGNDTFGRRTIFTQNGGLIDSFGFNTNAPAGAPVGTEFSIQLLGGEMNNAGEIRIGGQSPSATPLRVGGDHIIRFNPNYSDTLQTSTGIDTPFWGPAANANGTPALLYVDADWSGFWKQEGYSGQDWRDLFLARFVIPDTEGIGRAPRLFLPGVGVINTIEEFDANFEIFNAEGAGEGTGLRLRGGATIPEPSSALLLSLGALSFYFRRKRLSSGSK